VTSAAPFDDLDAAIFELLQGDGRLPYRTMARELGVPEGTVRFRVNRLVRDGAVQITALVHPQRLGGVLATVLVRVGAAERARVVEELSAIDAVVYSSTCAGRTQLMLQVVVSSLDELHGLLDHQIGAVDGVLEVETLLELEVHKARWHVPRMREQAGGT
jgi:Lrp/AsnC family transcriptional regulator, regulator for asnA, asnC and gidA